MTTHLVIPDTQVKPGVPTDHLRWIGRYILERKPDVIIHLGDHWDMPSLSSYDRGKRAFEGRRVKADIQAGNTGLRMLDEPTKDANRKRKELYLPDWRILKGNHENRIDRFEEDHPELEGVIPRPDYRDWTVHEFLEPVWIDGICYAHYFYNPMSGRPYGGTAHTRLKNLGHSFTQGHQQVTDYAMRPSGQRLQHGLIAGACYLHDEDYLGPQGNGYWRGIIVCHEVRDGTYDPMFVSLDYLCRRYEGVSLQEHLAGATPAQPRLL